MDTGLLLLRIVFGLLLVGHGTQKLFGWFGGYGLEGVGGFFHSIGFRPGRPMAVVAGLTEAGGGLLLALGLLTPFAGAVILGTLVVAGATHAEKGIWGTNGGYELALLYAVVGAGFALAGPGEASLDHVLDLDEAWSVPLGLLLCALAVAGAVALVARARAAVRRDAAAIDLREQPVVSTSEGAPAPTGR